VPGFALDNAISSGSVLTLSAEVTTSAWVIKKSWVIGAKPFSGSKPSVLNRNWLNTSGSPGMMQSV
jgi:hypothetical protein